MALLSWQDIKEHKGLFAFSSFMLLAYLAFVGFMIYVQILAMSLIIAALASTAMPYGLAVFIGILPILFSALMLLKGIQLASKALDVGKWSRTLKRFLSLPLRSMDNVIKMFKFLASVKEQAMQPARWQSLLGLLALPAALVLGIYLAVIITPHVIAAIAAAGVAHGLAVFMGIGVALAIINATYYFLVLPIQLSMFWDSLKTDWAKLRAGQSLAFLSMLGTLTALAFAGYLSSLVFPWIVNALVAFTPHGLAVFMALAICALLVVYTVLLVGTIVSFITPAEKPTARKGKEVETLDYIQDVVNEYHAFCNQMITEVMPQLLEQNIQGLTSNTSPSQITLTVYSTQILPNAVELETLRSDPYLKPSVGPVGEEDADSLLSQSQNEGHQSAQPSGALLQPIQPIRPVLTQSATEPWHELSHGHGAQGEVSV